MCSSTLSVFLVFLFFVTISEAGKRVDKIIIHVPYKILKHHHTHTKYRIITVHHSPKKENTIIYFQPAMDQHMKPKVPLDMEMKDSELKGFVPAHQVPEPLTPLEPHTEEHVQVQEIPHKNPTENEISHEGFGSSFLFKPTHHFQQGFTPITFNKPMISMHKHHIPQFLYKPFNFPPSSHEPLTPKFPLNHIPPLSQDIFTMKFDPMMLSHKLPPSTLTDSVPHTSSHTYKTIIAPKPLQKLKSYAVREVDQEGPQPAQAQMPQTKPENFMPNLLETNDKPDYEHVGYLIIDGDQRKVVGKDKHSLHSWG